MTYKKLFYDIEVFKRYSCIVFMDEDSNITIFESPYDTHKLREFISNKILIGYNNHNYDDIILDKILKGANLALINQVNYDIINTDKKFKLDFKNLTLDTSRQIDVSQPSLKKIQANLGLNIYETPIAFDKVDLSADDIELIKEYCINDVKSTKHIYELREDNYFNVKETLVDTFKLDKNLLKYNTTTIVSKILDKPVINTDRLTYLPIEMPWEVKEFWDNYEYYWDKKSNNFKGKMIVEEFDNIIEFGWGGLHSVHKDNNIYYDDVVLADLDSMYPNIMIKRKSLGMNTEKYKTILEDRLKEKKINKGSSLEQALKLILNSTYGLLGNQYSSLFNKLEAINVCIYGQQLIYSMMKVLYNAGCTIIQSNTDGVAFLPNGVDYTTLLDNWQAEQGYSLGYEYYKKFIQINVNNYVGLDENDKIKVKGGYVNAYHSASKFGTNSRRIIDIAIVNYLIYNIPVKQTVNNHKELIDFQIITQSRNTSKSKFTTILCDSNGVFIKEIQKVNRLVAVKNGNTIRKLNLTNGSQIKFADTPESVVIINDDINNIEDIDIDYDWYINVIERKLSEWRR